MSLILLLACVEGGLRWAESWEVIGLAEDGALLDLSFVRGNSGIWAGAGHVRGLIATKDEGSVLFGLDAMPNEVRTLQRGLAIGPDELSETGGVWTIVLQEGEALDGYRDLRLTVSDGHGRTDPVDMGHWQVEATEILGKAQGYSRVGQRDRLFLGNALVLHRKGERPPGLRGATRMAAFVMNDSLSIGVDQVGSQVLAWALIDGVRLPTDDAVLRIGPKNEVQLDFRPTVDLVVQITPRKPRSRIEPLGHLSPPEQLAMDAWVGTPTRRVSRGEAIGLYESKPLTAPAVLLWVDAEEEASTDGER